MKTWITLTVLVAMCFTSALYSQESHPDLAAMKQELKELNKQVQSIKEKIDQRRNILISTGFGDSVWDDPEMLKYEEELDIPYPRRKYLEKEINKIELAEILQSERTRNIYNEALADGPIFHIVITLYKDSLLKESVNIKDNDRAAAAVDSAHIIEKILYKGMLFELEDRLRLKREERLRRQSKDED